MSTADVLPTAKECMVRIAEAEAAKASEWMQRKAQEDSEKRDLLEKLQKPSGVDDEERMKRAAAIINRAVANGLSEVFIGRFPNALCTDGGRAINQSEPGWEKTLTGLPKELFEFWRKNLQPKGYRIKFQIVDFPGGMLGDVGVTLAWG
jgi:hypothetical protein